MLLLMTTTSPIINTTDKSKPSAKAEVFFLGIYMNDDSCEAFVRQYIDGSCPGDERIIHACTNYVYGRDINDVEILTQCPEERKNPEPCPVCGSTNFIFRLSNKRAVCIVYCRQCGSNVKSPKKRVTAFRLGNSDNFQSKIWERYEGKCAICGATEGLEIHHIIPNEYLYTLNNCILLCEKHHKQAHRNLARCIL